MGTKKFLAVELFFLILVFNAAAGEKSAVFVDLKNFPIFVKTGFALEDTRTMPDGASGKWKVIPPAGLRGKAPAVKNLGLPGVPKRTFLNPRGAEEMEFTFVIPFTFTEEGMKLLSADTTLIPGMIFGGIGDNWEVYLNGSLVKSEMYLDEAGRIRFHRNVYYGHFPVNRSFFTGGTNILALRVLGDPAYYGVGMFYSAPYHIDDYFSIRRNNDETLTLILIGVYLFLGLYHLFMYLIRRKDTYNFYYGLFSVVLGIYFLTRTNAMYQFFPNQDPLLRIEYFCVFLVIPLGCMFLEKLCRNRISLPTRICGAFFLFLALIQWFFSRAFAYDTLVVWQYSSMAMVPYILVYDVGYLFFTGAREIRKRYGGISTLECFGRTVRETAIGNLLAGVVVCLGTGVFDILDSLLFHFGITLTRYGFLTFTVGTTLILARRFSFLYSQQQRIIIRSNKGMNAKLVDWIVVQDRDPAELPSVNVDNAIMFTDVRNFTGLSEGMPSRTLTGFLGALNEMLARPLFDHEDKGAVAYTDKFMGDGMMNIFTDPGVALETAVEIRGQLKKFNQSPRHFFREAPEGFRVNIGTGIAYGPVTLGIMGHSRRVDYTPIGDTVNLASRLESLTREYHVSIIINDTLHGAVDHSRFNLRHIDRVRVKGREHPVDIYEEFSADPAPVRDFKRRTLPRLTELQGMYFSGRNWKDAVRLGKDMARISLEAAKRYGGRAGPADYMPFVYIRRMQTVMKDPELLVRWNGVYTFERK